MKKKMLCPIRGKQPFTAKNGGLAERRTQSTSVRKSVRKCQHRFGIPINPLGVEESDRLNG